MQIESPGQLLRSAWNFLVEHWKVIIPIIILPSVIGYIGNIIAYTKSPPLMALAALLGIVGAISGIVGYAAAAHAIHRLSQNPTEKVTLVDEYKHGFKYFWSILLVAIITTLVNLGSFALLIIPGVIVVVYGAFYLFALIIDDKRGFSALTESYSLVYGRWWPVLGRLLFLVLVVLIIQLVFAGIGFVSGLSTVMNTLFISSGDVTGPLPFEVFLLTLILNLISTAVVAPLIIAYLYKLYISLKSTRSATSPTPIFKKWLVAFLCVGIVVLALLPIAVAGIAYQLIKQPAFQQQLERELSQEEAAKLHEALGESFQGGLLQGNRPGGAGNP